MEAADRRATTITGVSMLLMLVAAAQSVRAAEYPARAPMARYLLENENLEIALARSAAPEAIAEKSDVMVLGKAGYRTAVKGTNGFVCLVWRSWSDDFDDKEFWNPRVRAPICLNPPAVRTVLSDYLLRTDWVCSGLGLAEMKSRFAAALSAGQLHLPPPGAMSYMMSKQGHLADGIGHASPHIMFFVPRADHQDWGANVTGSPIAGADDASDPVALFFVSVPRWSDGTPATAH